MSANLDPRALAAVNAIKVNKNIFAQGPIIPVWLAAALPPRSDRRGWRDYVAQYILCDIICAYRFRDGQVFFRGPLYQVNREAWAKQIPTTLKEISLTLTWLSDDLGVIGRQQRIRLMDGQPCGSQTFVWPIVPRLLELRNFYLECGHAMPVKCQAADSSSDTPQPGDGLESNSTPAFEATPPLGLRQSHSLLQSHSSLISATTPNAAEGNGEALLGAIIIEPAQDEQSLAIARGGKTKERQGVSGDASTQADLAPPVPKAPIHHTDATLNYNGDVHTTSHRTDAAPPHWSPPDPPKAIQVVTKDDQIAWRKAMRFCAMWQEAIVRSECLTSSVFTLADKQAVYSYFLHNYTVRGFFPLAVAMNAWEIARADVQPRNKHRRLYHIPHSLDPRQFIGSMNSGKIEAEVCMFYNVNAWETHRWWFTESELVYWGWNKASIPIKAIKPDQLWEYFPSAPNYYRARHRDLPPEVAAVVQQAGTAKDPSVSLSR